MHLEYTTRSAAETEALGAALAPILDKAPAVALVGGLGVGKTTLTRGIAQGFGCTEEARSPTYAIVNEYPGRRKICHFDLYRLAGEDDLYDIGWQDYLASGALCIVEWSQRAAAAMPAGSAVITIENTGGDSRLVRVKI